MNSPFCRAIGFPGEQIRCGHPRQENVARKKITYIYAFTFFFLSFYASGFLPEFKANSKLRQREKPDARNIRGPMLAINGFCLITSAEHNIRGGLRWLRSTYKRSTGAYMYSQDLVF
jgi:hypothetical protein